MTDAKKKKLLVAVDGSNNSIQAVDLVAEWLGGFDCTVGLVTIVLGRRGLSQVQQFFAGRVSTKVLQIGQKHHVWLVN